MNTLIKIFSVVSVVATLILVGCSSGANTPIDNTVYLASFSLDDSTEVEVLVSIKQKGVIVRNGEEEVFLKSVSEGVYSVPVFGGALVGNWVGEESERLWVGEWVDSLRIQEYRVPLKITPLGELDFVGELGAKRVVKSSIWDTDLGRFKMTQIGDSVTATFLTPTGDFRYQAGKINLETSRFKIGAFDGIHLFSFEGTISGDSIVNGVFKSGTHYHTSWAGVRAINNDVGWDSRQAWNPKSEILIKGVNSRGGVEVWTRGRLEKSGYKILVVDVMGTWCPNCMDEVRLLKDLSADYPEMLVLSMAFEWSSGRVALERIARFKTDLGVPWEVLLGGKANKRVADSTLAFIGGIRSFPTTAFIPLAGDPVIHSGFSGPATGELYEEEVCFFKNTIETLTRGSR